VSSTDNTTSDWRDETSSDRRSSLGMVRRMAIKLTSGTFWQALGHLLLDSTTPETRDVEVFSGIGFYARPKAGANVEAMVVFPAGASNPVVIATRDEDARKAVANLDQDSTAMFNRSTIIVCKPDGTVEIKLPGGTPQPLPTLAEFNGHTHPAPGGATSPPTTPATGTTVLKAQ
jgi:phage gp45-like